MQAFSPECERDMIAIDINSHGLPRRPHLVRKTAIEILVRFRVRPSDYMEHVRRGIDRLFFKVARHDLEPCQFFEACEVCTTGSIAASIRNNSKSCSMRSRRNRSRM